MMESFRCFLSFLLGMLLVCTCTGDQDAFSSAISMCGCRSCTAFVFNSMAGDYSCGERILFLVFEQGLTEENACSVVAGEYPAICSPCDAKRCNNDDSNDDPQPIPVSDTVDATEPEPETSTTQAVTTTTTTTTTPAAAAARCGCEACTDDALDTIAGGHSCRDRIDFLLNTHPDQFPREEAACRQVAKEFPLDNQCGRCNPATCSIVAAVQQQQQQQHNQQQLQTSAGSTGRSRDMDIYCFHPAKSRTTYENFWGKYTVQVKENEEIPCGPSDNFFSARTVSRNGNDLKLQFKKDNNRWYSSEVRILLPEEEMPYKYGSYTFSVKSVKVIDSNTGAVVSTVLPQSLTLGLFTWDPTENYQIRENMNHEVDVEISRWNIANNADAQFLVQPPGDPQTDPQIYRFYTGDKTSKTYQQAPRIYGFDWRPTEVEWYSNAGNNGERFVYSTQTALQAGQVDYNQCMPANVEVRINLWNLHGSPSTPPPEMQDSYVVEVVIDNFQFTPNGLTAAPNGSLCSKDCHCGPSSQCIQNKCTAVGSVTVTSVNRQYGGSNDGGTRRRRILEGSVPSERALSYKLPMIVFFLVGSVLLMALLVGSRPDEEPKEALLSKQGMQLDLHGTGSNNGSFVTRDAGMVQHHANSA